MRDRNHTPYSELGSKLKSVRLKYKESLAEVCGAVEIEQDDLQKIEQGRQRPSEDVLLLLISHFEVQEEEAAKLWELAGYDRQLDGDSSGIGKQAVVVMPMEGRIIYSDQVQIAVNKYGVVMNFMQNMGAGNQMAVSRVGMSKEHAKKVLRVLRDTLEQSERTPGPKSLPGGEQSAASENS